MDPQNEHAFATGIFKLILSIEKVRRKDAQRKLLNRRNLTSSNIDKSSRIDCWEKDLEGDAILSKNLPDEIKPLIEKYSSENNITVDELILEINNLCNQDKFFVFQDSKIRIKKIIFSRGRLIVSDLTPKSKSSQNINAFFNRCRKLKDGEEYFISFSKLPGNYFEKMDESTIVTFMKDLESKIRSDIPSIKIIESASEYNGVLRLRAEYGLFRIYSSLSKKNSPRLSSTTSSTTSPTVASEKNITLSDNSKKIYEVLLIRKIMKVPDVEVLPPLTRKPSRSGMNNITPAKRTVHAITSHIITENSPYPVTSSEQPENYKIPSELARSLAQDPENIFERLHLIALRFIGEKGNTRENVVVGRKSCNSQMMFIENEISNIREKNDVEVNVTADLLKAPNSSQHYNLAKKISYTIRIGEDFHLPQNRRATPAIIFELDPLSTMQVRPLKSVGKVVKAVLGVLTKLSLSAREEYLEQQRPPSLKF